MTSSSPLLYIFIDLKHCVLQYIWASYLLKLKIIIWINVFFCMKFCVWVSLPNTISLLPLSPSFSLPLSPHVSFSCSLLSRQQQSVLNPLCLCISFLHLLLSFSSFFFFFLTEANVGKFIFSQAGFTRSPQWMEFIPQQVQWLLKKWVSIYWKVNLLQVCRIKHWYIRT